MLEDPMVRDFLVRLAANLTARVIAYTAKRVAQFVREKRRQK
jgi:hypothetical protein